ncbi:MAG: hypothetical protein U9O59_00380 [Actinomycetota bacterium]|nr:hypothetical protein [Actinomycetota bacterium]
MKEVKLLLERAATKLSAAKVLLREGYFDDAVSRADYSIICEITEEEAKSVINDADVFLKRIEEAIEKIT